MTVRNNTLIIELHYLPSIPYFAYLASFRQVIIDIGEAYSKQSYRNRCRINGANKIENLIIPVKGGNKKKVVSEVEIDYDQKWLNNHLKAIQSAYGKAPFYEFYAEDLFEIYRSKPRQLVGLTARLLTKCLELLELQTDIKFNKNLEIFSNSGSINMKNTIHPKKILPERPLYFQQNYFQVFGKNFVPCLSVIDLLFCAGPEACSIIRKSAGAFSHK